MRLAVPRDRLRYKPVQALRGFRALPVTLQLTRRPVLGRWARPFPPPLTPPPQVPTSSISTQMSIWGCCPLRRSWSLPPSRPATWLARERARTLLLLGELGKREGWRAEGATSLEAWIVERCGVSRSPLPGLRSRGGAALRPPGPGRWPRRGRADLRQGACGGRHWPRRRDGSGAWRSWPGSARSGELARAEPVGSKGAPRSRARDGLRGALGPLQRQLPHRDGPAPARVLCRGASLVSRREPAGAAL